MTQQRMVNVWNKGFGPGTLVRVEKKEVIEGKTITRAEIQKGRAVVYVDGMHGAVPLSWVRPVPGVGRRAPVTSCGSPVAAELGEAG